MIDNFKTLFPDFNSSKLLEEINNVASIKEFVTDEVLIDLGGYIKAIPLIVSGLVKIVKEDKDGNELLMYYLAPGQTCTVSLTCCLSQQKSEIKAVVEEDAKMIMVPIKYMDEWMIKYKDWRKFVMTNYRTRFEDLFQTIDSIAFHKLDQRLLTYLKIKAKAKKVTVLKATHKEIAYDLNSSREVVSRLLKQLEKQGGIKLGRNMIDLSKLL